MATVKAFKSLVSGLDNNYLCVNTSNLVCAPMIDIILLPFLDLSIHILHTWQSSVASFGFPVGAHVKCYSLDHHFQLHENKFDIR